MKSWFYNTKVIAFVLVLALVLPSIAQAQGDCSWVDAGSGFGGWYDSNGQPCTPDTGGSGEPMSTGEYQAWLTLSWWLFVIGWFILTGVPL